MTLLDYANSIPDYYSTMYLDGYTPEQILQAMHNKISKEYMASMAKQEEVSEINITSSVKVKK